MILDSHCLRILRIKNCWGAFGISSSIHMRITEGIVFCFFSINSVLKNLLITEFGFSFYIM